MFGNKDKRDYALLLFMGLVILLFLAYLFIPSGKAKDFPDNRYFAGNSSMPTIEGVAPGSKKNSFSSYNKRLEGDLTAVFASLDNLELLSALPTPEIEASLYNVDTKNARTKETALLSDVLQKIRRLSVINLKEILELNFPDGFKDRFRFNVYTAALLSKISNENVGGRLNEASNQEIQELLDFSLFDLIGNEIEKDYQALPVLLYFELLMERINLYTDPGAVAFFREAIVKLRDLSPKKMLLQMQEMLHYSEENELFRLEWREGDELDPDDVGVYQKLSLPCIRFLKQKYLIFPTQRESDNLWISELCNADSGDIELEDIKIYSEDPGRSVYLNRILYTPDTSRFIFVLSDAGTQSESDAAGDSTLDILSRRVSVLIRDLEKNYRVVSFEQSDDEATLEKQRQELVDFGRYLKTINF